MEFENRPVEFVGTALGHDVDHRSLVAAELRRVVVRDDLELLHRILIRDKEVRSSDREVVIVSAIEREVVCASSVSVYRKGCTVRVNVTKPRHDAGSQQRERVDTATRSVRGKFFNFASLEAGGNLRVGLNDLFGVTRDRYRLRWRTDG